MNKNLFHTILFLFCMILLCSCSMNPELQGYVLGNATPVLFGASVGCQILTALIMLIRTIKKRDPNSTRTPPAWSWSFFWRDSIWSVVMTFLFILIAARILFYFKIDPNLAIIISLVLGGFADRFGSLFAKASQAASDIVDEKIDHIADTLHHTDVNVASIKKDVEEIKDQVTDNNQKTSP